ncbi:ankyrin repeat domain-containing protein [Clostridium manihotivorum]|uniref:Uncharacterized protein n=1 Tax=Clostridium manihotivorum TaxID=2320868 RepID=A0A410DYF8_9CLOT|nr:ankyrin repeat domain-containing protein [Clostridium manihotivorum]QAA34088.1 hypothetical protein C1I91_22030 [Clostridium manihotivorum]
MRKRKIFSVFICFFMVTLVSCSTNNNNKISKYDSKTYFTAIESNDIKLVESVIDQGVDKNSKNEDERTPLIYSLLKGRNEIAKLLIDKGADVNAIDKYKDTALNEAILNVARTNKNEGNIDIIKMLLDKGADLNSPKVDKTPLQWASETNVDVVKLLLDYKADVNISFKSEAMMNSDKPLYIAVKKDKVDIAKLLIERGADINIKVSYYNHNYTLCQNLLEVAVDKKEKNMIELLLSNNINVNIQDENGVTPLIIVAQNKDEDMFNFLVSKGANQNIKDKEGITALEIKKQTEQMDARAKSRATEEAKNPPPKILEEPRIGMSAEEVEKSSWGKPKSVNRTTTKLGTKEQWVYSGDCYIYLENGIVTAIQDH